MADSIRSTRKNGCSPPFTPAQVSTWIFLPLLVVEFVLVITPLLPLAASIPCTVVFCCLALASTVFAYLAMTTDPSDPRLLKHRQEQCAVAGQGNGAVAQFNAQDPTKQCWICDIQVGVKSMHCKFCNKCVDHFDHHCMWLNTCVGKANYKYFFRTMLSINLMLLVQLLVQIVIILDIYLGDMVGLGGSRQKAEEWFGVGTVIPVVAIMGFFAFLNIASLSLIGQLLVFHLKLQKEGISTYEFILQDNRKRRERTAKLNELKVRRKTEIATAREEGKSFYAMRLEKGGILREKFGIACCDPLALDEKDDENAETNGEP